MKTQRPNHKATAGRNESKAPEGIKYKAEIFLIVSGLLIQWLRMWVLLSRSAGDVGGQVFIESGYSHVLIV